MKPVVISTNTSWNLVNFRAGLIDALRAAGFRVVAVAPNDGYAEQLQTMGCEFVALPIDAHGRNPMRDLMLTLRYWRLMRRLRPLVFLGFTIKPNVYGTIAASLAGVPVINNIAGLGTTFLRKGWITRVAKVLYRVSLRRSVRVFFQNRDDMELFLGEGLALRERSALLPGSGVNLSHFASHSPPDGEHPMRFLLVARLLWDKGIGEFVEALRILRGRCVEFEASLLGFIDEKNPSGISREQVEAWQKEGLLRYLGAVEDVRATLAEADAVVLPSYREGTPRSLLEAAAMSKPLITTDTPGCRDLIDEGRNGYLVPIKDARMLADAMQAFTQLEASDRVAMGAASRSLVESSYDERLVIDRYLEEIEALVAGTTAPA